MNIMQVLRNHLLNQSEVSNLISTRLYPIRLPQSASFPSISFRRVTEGHDHNLDSASGVARPRFQFDCFSRTYSEAQAVAEALRNSLQGFSGDLEGVEIHSITFDNRADFYEKPQDGSDVGLYHIALDFFVLHEESVPQF